MKRKWGLNEWGSIASITGGLLGVLSIWVTVAPPNKLIEFLKPKS